MLASFIITFRESLEAALIIGIILAYLSKTHGKKYYNIVYLGVVSAVAASIIVAFAFNLMFGGFTGRAEEVFEGIVMLFASALITYMILWMLKQRHIRQELQEKVDREIHEEHRAGLFFLTFLSVFREGVETVIFLEAAQKSSPAESPLLGGMLGLIAAIVLGYLIFVGAKSVNIKAFFNVTSVLLVLFAAGLFSHGIHELQEAGIVPVVIEHAWDINPEQNLDGSYPALHENGAVGSILKSLFGYNGNPSLIEALAYLSYILAIFILYKNINKVHKVI